MNLRDLQYLVAVAEYGHFGKAARASFVSQPTLSMQLKKLEEYLGVQLFERTNRQVSITPVGEEIAAIARHILQDVAAIRELAGAAQDPFAGKLRLGAFPTIAPYLLPQVIPAIHRTYPKLQLLLLEEKTSQLIERLRQGKLDAALLALPIEAEELETHALFDDPFFLAVPVNHHLASHASVRLTDVRNESLLLLEEGHCLRSQALEVCSMVGASEQQEFRATSLETLRQMVAGGVGITLIPRLAHKSEDGIAYLPFAEPAPSRTIGMVWRRQTSRRQALEAIAALIRTKFLH